MAANKQKKACLHVIGEKACDRRKSHPPAEAGRRMTILPGLPKTGIKPVPRPWRIQGRGERANPIYRPSVRHGLFRREGVRKGSHARGVVIVPAAGVLFRNEPEV